MVLQLRISFQSDWHVGTGSSESGGLDRLIARDNQGFPYIPAKTLVGILRDATEEFTSALGDSWPLWTDLLFGSQSKPPGGPAKTPPRPASLWIRPAYLPAFIRNTILESPHENALRKAFTLTRSSTAIDPKTGTALRHSLRMIELARGGLELHADVSIIGLHEDDFTLATHVLAAACQLVELIGSKRRRGLGKCKVSLWRDGKRVDLGDRKNVDTIFPSPATAPTIGDTNGAPSHDPFVVDSSGGWETIKLEITAKTPLLFPRSILGNQVSTYDYIPGTSLLPVVHSALERAGIDATSAIAAGQVRITRGHPMIDGHRSFPMSLAFAEEKTSAGNWVNTLLPNESIDQSAESHTPTKQLRGGWVCLDNAKVRCYSVAMTERVHNSVDDEKQRPLEGGGIFSYLSIDPGQQFCVTVQFSEAICTHLGNDLSKFIAAMCGQQSLGGSRKNDYGSVEITATVEIAPNTAPTSGTDPLRLSFWCLSDILISDERLRPVVTPEGFFHAINDALITQGVELISAKVDELKSEIRTTRIDSWQTRWALPRNSLLGIASGSCISLELAKPLNEAQFLALHELERSGLGERCAEGFGEVVFNPSLLQHNFSHSPVEQYDPKTPPHLVSDESPKLSGDELFILQQLARTATLANLKIAAVDVFVAHPKNVETLLKWKTPTNEDSKETLTNAQLGNLREFLLSLDPTVEPEQKLADKFINRSGVQNKWPKNAREKLSELLSEKNKVWEMLKKSEPLKKGEQTVIVAFSQDQIELLKDKLWLEAMRTVVEAAYRARTRQERPITSGQS